MTDISVPQPAIAATPNRPYAPSGFDRFTDWVDRLSISGVQFYLILGAIMLLIQIAIQWTGNIETIPMFPLAYIITFVYDLATMHYLDKVAADSLKRFRPLLSITDAEYNDLLYRLTTLPARPALLSTLLGAFFGLTTLVWIPFSKQINEFQFANTPLSIHFNHALAPLIWGIVALELYHTLHQLRVVQEIYKRCSYVDLYTLRPLYAFSTLSARTAVGIGFIAYLWFLLAPTLFNIGVNMFVFFTGFSLLTFVVPLWGAHRLLVDEKDQKLSENGERQRAAVAELHRRVDAHEMVDMDNLNKTMSSLELEHLTLDRISTWPWRPETVRAVAAALFFPVIVWLTQWVLERVLS